MKTYNKEWLIEEISSNRSKQNIIRLANIAQQDSHFLDLIFELSKSNIDQINWRSAWILDHVNQIDKQILLPYLNQIVDFLATTKNDSIRRTYLKIIGQNSIPEKQQGLLLDLCFELLNNPLSPIAVRAWCMDILFKLVKIYSEIGIEFKLSLEFIINTGSSGEKAKARKMFNQLKMK